MLEQTCSAGKKTGMIGVFLTSSSVLWMEDRVLILLIALLIILMQNYQNLILDIGVLVLA